MLRRLPRGLQGRTALLLACVAIPRLCAASSVVQDQMSISAAPAVDLTLDRAITAALANDPAYRTAAANAGSARLDAAISRSALLPNADGHGECLYARPNGVHNQRIRLIPAAPRFIANNAIREYAAQVMVNETVSVANVSDYRRARALAAQSTADLESARRDLVVRVVTAYFRFLAAGEKADVAKSAEAEAQNFLDLTQKLESGRGSRACRCGEGRARIGSAPRNRKCRAGRQRARLDLGVLLFPDPRTPFQLRDAGGSTLPERAAVEAAAERNNPDLRSALEAVHAAELKSRRRGEAICRRSA